MLLMVYFWPRLTELTKTFANISFGKNPDWMLPASYVFRLVKLITHKHRFFPFTQNFTFLVNFKVSIFDMLNHNYYMAQKYSFRKECHQYALEAGSPA